MGIRALCAAAAVVVGVGQAEAATYNVMFTIARADHVYYPADNSEYTITPLGEWRGMLVNSPLRGLLKLEEGITPILSVGGKFLFGGGDAENYADGSWWQTNETLYDYLTWTGAEGTWMRREDNLPDYLFVDADIQLAPVPLPATAALLPMGIGALALMRKRRRLVS